MAKGDKSAVPQDARELRVQSLALRMNATALEAERLATLVSEMVGIHVGAEPTTAIKLDKEVPAEGMFGQMGLTMDAIDAALGYINAQMARL